MTITNDEVILVIVLIADIVNGMIREIIVLLGTTTRNKRGEAIATILISSVIVPITISIILVYLTVITCIMSVKSNSLFCHISGFLQLLGVMA